MTPAIIYRRVSTDKQERSGLSIEAQYENAARFAESRGWTAVAVFTDNNVSSATPLPERPAGAAAAALARTLGAVVVVTALDRIGRSTEDYLALLRSAAAEGWRIEAMDMSGIDPTTPDGKMIHSIRMSVAEYEKALIGIRTSAALRAKLRRGERVGRAPEVDPFAIARAKELREDGLSYAAIAERLGVEGFRPPRAGTWHRKTVSRMVTGEPWGRVSREMMRADLEVAA